MNAFVLLGLGAFVLVMICVFWLGAFYGYEKGFAACRKREET